MCKMAIYNACLHLFSRSWNKEAQHIPFVQIQTTTLS